MESKLNLTFEANKDEKLRVSNLAKYLRLYRDLGCSRQILQRSLAIVNCTWWPLDLAVIGRKWCYLRWTRKGASTSYILISTKCGARPYLQTAWAMFLYISPHIATSLLKNLSDCKNLNVRYCNLHYVRTKYTLCV